MATKKSGHGGSAGKRKRAGRRAKADAAETSETRSPEAALRESEERYRTLVESALDGIVIHSGGRVAFANRAAAAMLGLAEPAALVGQPLESFVHPDDLAGVQDRVRRVQAGEAVAYPVEIRYVKRDGTELPVENTGALVTYEGKPATLAVIRDITERKRADELSCAQRDLAQALSATTSLDTALRLCLDAAIRVSGMDAGGIYLVDKTSGDLDLVADDGLSPAFVASVAHYQADSASAHLVQVGQPIYARRERLGVPMDDARLREGLRASAVIPVLHERRVIACLNLASHTLDEAPVFARHPLETIAAQFGGTIARLRAGQALRESEERHRNLVESSNDWVWETDANAVLTFASANVVDLLGYTPEEVVGRSAYDLMPPGDAAKAREAFGPLVAQRKAFRGIENTNLHKNGRRVVLESNGVPVFDESGAFRGYRGMDRDITDRKRVEEALRESEARYRRITEGLTDYQYTVRVEHGRAVETRQGPACARVTGYTAEEYAADPYLWIQMVTPEDRDRVREHARLVLAGEDVPSIEHRIVRKDGAVRWVSDTAIPLKDASGRLLSYDGVISDITERKRAEEEKAELEARNRQLQKAESLSRMAGAIAHHFNNQLQTVLMGLELAEGDLLQDSGPARRVTEAMMAAHRAAAMSKLMLVYLGQAPGVHESLDLSIACSRWLSLLEVALPKRVVLEIDLASPGPTIRANAEQIQQVLTNLVANAWEAGGAGRGEIQVTVKAVTSAEVPLAHRVPPDWQPLGPVFACLEVVDHGCGVAEADIEKLFDPFFSTKFTGRGLGLPVVLGIVRSHGGVVTVESTPGSGSVFRVYLPVPD